MCFSKIFPPVEIGVAFMNATSLFWTIVPTWNVFTWKWFCPQKMVLCKQSCWSLLNNKVYWHCSSLFKIWRVSVVITFFKYKNLHFEFKLNLCWVIHIHIRKRECGTLRSTSMTLEVLMASLEPWKSKGCAGLYENHNLEIGALSFETAYCTGVEAISVCAAIFVTISAPSASHTFTALCRQSLSAWPPFCVEKD